MARIIHPNLLLRCIQANAANKVNNLLAASMNGNNGTMSSANLSTYLASPMCAAATSNFVMQTMQYHAHYSEPTTSSSSYGCYNCGDESHLARECPYPDRRKNKLNTEKRPRRANSNAPVKCFACGEEGHISKDCPMGTDICFNCGERGHYSTECPKPRREPKKEWSDKCLSCGKEGHRARECPHVVCYNCGREGHIALDCPMEKQSRVVICYRCGNEGHISRDCTTDLFVREQEQQMMPM